MSAVFTDIENEIKAFIEAEKELKGVTIITSKTFTDVTTLTEEANRNAKGAIAINCTGSRIVKSPNPRLNLRKPIISVILFSKNLGQTKSNIGIYDMIDIVNKLFYTNQYELLNEQFLSTEDVKGIFAYGLEFESERPHPLFK